MGNGSQQVPTALELDMRNITEIEEEGLVCLRYTQPITNPTWWILRSNCSFDFINFI